MSGKGNIEDFLRSKFDELETPAMGDWSTFEKKLDQALWTRRARSFASLALFVFALLAGYNSIQSLGVSTTDHDFVKGIDYEMISLPSYEVEDLGQVTIVSNSSESQEISKTSDNKATAKTSLETAAGLKKSTPVAMAATEISKLKGSEANPVVAAQDSRAEKNEQTNTTPVQPGEEPSIAALKPRLLAFDLSSADQSEDTEGVLTPAEELPYYHLVNLSIARNPAFASGDPRSLRPPISLKELSRAERVRYISHLQDKNPWSYAINVYPNFTFRKFKVDRKKINFLHRDFIDAIEASESGGFSLNVGLGISRRIGAITYLTGGVEYITYNTEASFNFKNFRDAHVNEVTGEITHYNLKESPENIVFADRNSYHYINFPLTLSYKPWATSHIRLNLEAGGSFMYFVGAKGRTIDYTTLEEIDLSSREYRNTLGSFSVKVGANYYVSESINFGFEPTLMYFTNTIYTQEVPFYVIPYSVGLNLHMQVKLN